MQNVVAVASTSPPVVVASTKSDALAATASIQDPFELILKKTSERYQENERDTVVQNDGPSATEISNMQRPSGVNQTNQPKEKKEVKQTQNTKKDVDSKQETKDEKSVEQEETDQEGVASVVQAVVYAVQPSVEGEIVSDVPVESIDPSAVEIIDTVFDENKGFVNSQNKTEGEPGSETMLDVDPKSIFQKTDNKIENYQQSDSLLKQEVVNQQSSATTQPTANIDTIKSNETVGIDEYLTNAQSQNVTVSAETDDKVSVGKTSKPIVNSVQNQNISSSIGNTGEMEETTAVVKDNAPPDTPKVTENMAINASATVTNTSQINEPARLAEAPKTEVIAQVASQVEQMVKTNRSSVRMQLYPEELGHIDIKIVSTKSGIGVTMIADSAATQNALKSDMNSLKQNMQQAGIQLSDLNIGQEQNSNKQQNFDEKKQFGGSTYQNANSYSSKSLGVEKKVQLQVSAVDYRI